MSAYDEMILEGIEKGKAEGKAEGIVEGEARGKAEGRFEIARTMLQNNEPLEKIITYTGLSETEVKNLMHL